MTTRNELLPSTDELVRVRQVAAGLREPDLVVRGGRVLSPGTEEWLEVDILVCGRHIAALTPWGHVGATRSEVDARGQYVVPGFIDSHLHVEYTNLTPGELARLSVPRGTTTVLADPNAAANVWGERGMDFTLRTGTPLHLFQQVSPTTPASALLERGGAVIAEAAVRRRLHDDGAVTLGEGNPFDLGEESTGRFREALVAGRRITGHTGGQSGESLWSYLAAGVGDDHNAATLDQVLERVRLGSIVTVMASSLADNMPAIFHDLDRLAPALRSLAFCADDKHADDLRTTGHIDHHVRQAVRLGVDPLRALRMASAVPAAHYRLDHILGTLAPSRLADLLLLPDLVDIRPSVVVVAGEVVARGGEALFANDDDLPAWAEGSIHLSASFGTASLRVDAPAGVSTARVRAMALHSGYFTAAFTADLPVVDAAVHADPVADVLKVAVIDRHHGTGETGVGFVRGFGLREGALAISMNCPNMNIAVVGCDDATMVAATREVERIGGGFVVVDGQGSVLARVPLPVGGMMSAAPYQQTADALREAHATAARLGCPIPSPFIVLSFVGLYTVPDLAVTERGLVDTATQSFVDVVVPGPADGCAHAHGAIATVVDGGLQC